MFNPLQTKMFIKYIEFYVKIPSFTKKLSLSIKKKMCGRKEYFWKTKEKTEI